MLTSLTSTLGPYLPALISLVVLPLVGALLNWALWWDTPAHWDAFAAKYPGRARVIRVLRAVFPHLRKALAAWRDAQTAKSQSGSADVATLAFLGAVGAVLLSGAVLVGCPRPTPPSDGGTSTPAAWTDTASVVLHALAWALPAAEVVVDATVPQPARAAVDRAIAGTVEAATGLQSALDAYTARGGDRCVAYAAVGGLTRAFVVLAQTLADQGIALGSTLTPIVQSLGAIADQLVPACQVDAGFASAGDATGRALRAIEADAAAHGRMLRPVLDGLRPVTP
jgi:hypothetical protein